MKSRSLAVVLLSVLLVGSSMVGTVAAVQSQPAELPEESEVGTDFSATFEITDLYNSFNSWTLAGETELENATWTIKQYGLDGSELTRTETDGQDMAPEISEDDGTARVEVRVTGTTPEIENLSYQPPDRFVVASFTQEREGGSNNDIATHESHHYTSESKEAREAIASAEAAVEGSASDAAQLSLESAISAYESGDFDNAINNAERAENEAGQSQLIRNVLFGAGVVVVLAILIGAGYWIYKSRQQDTSRLR